MGLFHSRPFAFHARMWHTAHSVSYRHIELNCVLLLGRTVWNLHLLCFNACTKSSQCKEHLYLTVWWMWRRHMLALRTVFAHAVRQPFFTESIFILCLWVIRFWSRANEDSRRTWCAYRVARWRSGGHAIKMMGGQHSHHRLLDSWATTALELFESHS